jgi:hypothetical protein
MVVAAGRESFIRGRISGDDVCLAREDNRKGGSGFSATLEITLLVGKAGAQALYAGWIRREDEEKM